MPTSRSFFDLTFGDIAAEEEAKHHPELLIEGFYDPSGIAQNVIDGRTWLVLGPKGAGKSAITEHIGLRAASEGWHIRSLQLLDFPFLDLESLDVGGETRGARLPVVWTYLICVQILHSLYQDEALQAMENSDFQAVIKDLQKSDLLPSQGLRDTLFRVKQVGLKAKPPGLEASVDIERINRGGHPFYWVTDRLVETISNVSVDDTHFIMIDGLDTLSLGEDDEARWAVITALVTACKQLADKFSATGVGVRIVLLCRSDIFFNLGYSDGNKILGTSASLLNWFPTNRRPSDTQLFDLAEKKASVGAGPIADIVREFLPSEIEIDGRKHRIHEYLTSFTRYLPRDFLQLMTFIARASPRRGLPGMNDVRDGAKAYATEYFVEEIRTGLLPLLGRRDVGLLFDVLNQVPGDRFKLGDLNRIIGADRRYKDLDLIKCVHGLHAIGAIANVSPANRGEYLNFVFHNPRARLDLSGKMTFHNALTIGLNRQRGDAARGLR